MSESPGPGPSPAAVARPASALVIGGLVVANLLLGFVMQAYVLFALKPGAETDALFATAAIPTFVAAVVFTALGRVLTPLLAIEEPGAAGAPGEGPRIVVLVTMFSLVVALALAAAAPLLVRPLFPGFTAEARDLSVRLGRIQLAGLAFTGATTALTAVYHARQRFIRTQTVPVLVSLVGLAALVLAVPRGGVLAVAWIGIGRGLLHALLLVPGLGAPARRAGPSPLLKEAGRRLKPLLVGQAYVKSGPLVDRSIASLAPTGGLSLLHFAQQVYGAVAAVVDRSIVEPLLPVLARHDRDGDAAAFRRAWRRAIFPVVVAAPIGLAILVLAGRPLVDAVAMRGGFRAETASLLFAVLVALAGMPTAGTAAQVLVSAFYARGDTRTAAKITTVNYTISVGLRVLGFAWQGVIGLAVGISAYHVLNAAVLLRALERGSPPAEKRAT